MSTSRTPQFLRRYVAAVGMAACALWAATPAQAQTPATLLALLEQVRVRAEQAGDAQFLTAPAVQREITVLPAPTPLRVSEVSIVSGGRLRFRLDGPAAKSAVLQFSPDLKAWIAVSTNTVPVTLEPPMVSDSAAGFYRAVLQ